MKIGLRPPLNVRRIIAVIALAAVLTNLAFTTNFTRAQQLAGTSVSISPVIFEITVNPGEIREDVVTVRNTSDTEIQTFAMSVEPFIGTEIGEAVIVEEGDPAYSLKEWVRISPTKFTLGPKESQTVSFRISVPSNAEPGGRYGSILASTDKGAIGETGAVTVQRVGSLVLLTVRGVIAYDAFIQDFLTVDEAKNIKDKKPKTVFETGPVNFIAKIRNRGTVHIKPQGFVTVSNATGKKVADIAVPPRNVLPNSNRAIEIKWDNPKIGYYTATLVANYGDKNEQLTATTSFWVFPWKKGLPLIAVGLFALWFVIARRRRVFKAIAIIFGRS